MVDFIVECIIDLVLEGTFEISKDRKMSKFIRYPLICIIVLLFLMIIGLMFFIGISIMRSNFYLGLLIIFLTLFFLYYGVKKFKIIYLTKKGDL